jgi:crossover junction endodeoxyribonuclease RuvC
MTASVRILGIDPGLRHMGWGIVESAGTRLSFVACGSIHSDGETALSERLRYLHQQLSQVIEAHWPQEAAVEETFVNRDPQGTLKLGQARGIALVVPALAGLPVAEYAANLVKKTIVGTGHAEKQQIAAMLKVLLPKSHVTSPDAADALAVAITHAHHRRPARLEAAVAKVAGLASG